MLERDDPEQTWLFLALALATESEEGRKQAREILRGREPHNTTYSGESIALDIPLLLGEPELAKQASSVLLARELPPSQWEGWQHRARYLADQETEDDFLERADPFSGTKCVAHYTVAMRALAMGDRDKARQHFTIVSKTGKPTAWCYRWGKAFLAKMENSPTWPDWIQVRQRKSDIPE